MLDQVEMMAKEITELRETLERIDRFIQAIGKTTKEMASIRNEIQRVINGKRS